MSRLSRLRLRGASFSDANYRLPPEFRFHSQEVRDRVLARTREGLDRARAVYLQAQALVPQYRPKWRYEDLPPIAEPQFVRRHPRIIRSPILRNWRNIKAGKYWFCVRRKVRREVMHALRIAGKRGIGVDGVDRVPSSYYHCGG